MRVSILSMLLVAMFAVLFSPGARAEDDKEEAVALDKVPKAVVDSIKKMFPGAELKKATKEIVKDEDDDDESQDDDDDKKTDGKEKEEDDDIEESTVIYEVTLTEKGLPVEVSVEEDGEIEEVERSIDLKELPKIVTDALVKKFPNSTLKSAEAIYEVEDGELEFEGYEVILVTADKKEIEVDIEVEIEISVD